MIEQILIKIHDQIQSHDQYIQHELQLESYNSSPLLLYEYYFFMNKLIIYAHPKKWSFTESIVTTIKEKSLANKHNVEVIDLYNQYPQPFLVFSREPIPHQEDIHAHITKADEIIFVFPIRWIDCPAIMKNFIDTNLNKWFAYKTNENGKEVGLLQGKKVRIVATAGGPSFFYPFIWFITRTMGRIWYTGMKHISTDILAHTMTCSQEKRTRFLKKVSIKCSK